MDMNSISLFVVKSWNFSFQEMQENVKKCRNFLATLIKLASHNSPSPETSRNVKALVQDLLVSLSFLVFKGEVFYMCITSSNVLIETLHYCYTVNKRIDLVVHCDNLNYSISSSDILMLNYRSQQMQGSKNIMKKDIMQHKS